MRDTPLRILEKWKDQLNYYNEGWGKEETEKEFEILKKNMGCNSCK